MEKITDAAFAAKLTGSKPVLVDVYADWCQPCKFLAPVLERVAKDFAGRAEVVKMDGETEVKTVTEYKVSALPTLLFFKGGVLAHKLTGLQTEKTIKDTLESLI
jgi:thioredoxin 1